MMRRALALVLVLAVALGARVAPAGPRDLAEAKEYFKAGAAAYAAGDYLAAIQALEAAYARSPLPAIAFSLAQAERRQYFVSRERPRLLRAIELFRRYLAEVPTGGRRADATDALGQLEPLALASEGTAEPAVPATPAAKTRLMVSAEAPDARISLDGAPAVASPLIAEVQPGPHEIRIEAPGFVPSERSLVAVGGELVPVDVVLRERPSVLVVHAPPNTDLYVDGVFVGRAARAHRLELASGPHVIGFAKKGHRFESVELELGRGERRDLRPRLRRTPQRVIALALFIGSGAAFSGGLALTALAGREQNEAEEILRKRAQGNIDSGERAEYDEALTMRERLRVGAVASFALSAAALGTGLLLYELDAPNPKDESPLGPGRTRPRRAPRVGAVLVPHPDGLGLQLGGAF